MSAPNEMMVAQIRVGVLRTRPRTPDRTLPQAANSAAAAAAAFAGAACAGAAFAGAAFAGAAVAAVVAAAGAAVVAAAVAATGRAQGWSRVWRRGGYRVPVCKCHRNGDLTGAGTCWTRIPGDDRVGDISAGESEAR